MIRLILISIYFACCLPIFAQDFDTITDARDGQQYRIVRIGSQWWMAENVKAIQYADGTAIPNVTEDTQWANLNSTAKAYCWYENDSISYAQTYGALYTWAAAMNGAISCNGIDCSSASNALCSTPVQGVCPTGWHIPSHHEWTVLYKEVETLNDDFQCDESSLGPFGGDASGHLKTTDTTYWTAPNAGSTNSSGFSALPSGKRNEQPIFSGLGDLTLYWSSTEYSSDRAWGRNLSYSNTGVYVSRYLKIIGRSVRCVRDGLSLDSLHIDKVNVSCNEYSDGSIVVRVLDEGEFTYKWSTGDTTSYLSDLPAGEYWLTISDSLGASLSESIIVTEPPPVQVEFTTTPSCYGDSTGSITAVVAGGMPPYSYLWSNNESTADLTGVATGIFTVTVTDNNDCYTLAADSVSEYPEIVTGQITGQANVDPAGIYVYSVNQKPGSDFTWIVNGGNIISGLGTNSLEVQWGSAGTGMVSVVETDEHGCNGDTVRLEVLIGTTNIDKFFTGDLRFYPNPSGDLITVETNQPGQHFIEITSLNGQLLYNRNIEGPTHQIDLSLFQKGVYFITIRSKDFVRTEKIIKL